ELERQGVLEEFGVTMIGATADAIDKAEDRRRFDIAMKKIGLEWVVTVLITFFPAGVSLFALTVGRDGNRKDLHGNARFANRREL
ncbi:hypothetical protein MJM95_28245, partial [Salmonella enterica subsp. enterica serovar Anatum]|nr:hypothetical protein [Salmonella enterica subsp. enterica serovar Anatum]